MRSRLSRRALLAGAAAGVGLVGGVPAAVPSVREAYREVVRRRISTFRSGDSSRSP